MPKLDLSDIGRFRFAESIIVARSTDASERPRSATKSDAQVNIEKPTGNTKPPKIEGD